MSNTIRRAAEITEWKLLGLTPEYLESEHGVYVSAIETALKNDQIRNIALSGNYGVGKSSILREVARRNRDRVVELSLSTLAPIETTKLDESVPIQATTPTNRIQQEIVKQLLYREEPGRMPGSRFRRIERFQTWREITGAILLGFILSVVASLTGWSDGIASVVALPLALATLALLIMAGGASHIESVVDPLLNPGNLVHPFVWMIMTFAVLLVRYLFYGRFHITQFSAGPATVTLDDKSVTYFDQYLDEIIYFFDVSKHDVVIFEDIDRFNDSHIFETLRSLNTLLNASPQIDKPVRFIYAVKDSIFDLTQLENEGRKLDLTLRRIEDSALGEAVRANRTKFFDLVIPVVPFITHRSARNLAARLLDHIEHKVEPELLDLATQHVPDMRLLKNIHNEFIVFRDRIFSGDGKQLDLSETDLFAMMLYKSTHLTDFEAIRIGKSKLDELYRISRDLVSQNVSRIERERLDTRQHLARIDGAATRGKQLGERFLTHASWTAQAAGYSEQHVTYSFANRRVSSDELASAQFWSELVTAEGNPPLQWNNNLGRQLSFTREALETPLGDPLDANSWDEDERNALNEKLSKQVMDLKFLRSADMDALIRQSDLRVKLDGEEQSLEEIARSLLNPGLAFQLVRNGYLNRNFTLYTSTFHGNRVGPAATNFIIHHVERDAMDAQFELGPDDVDAVVRERGRNALGEPALYNISILDHLLRTDIAAADIMVRSLARLGEIQTHFLQDYLNGGEERAKFIERFTLHSSQTLVHLVSRALLDDASRLDLMSVALRHLKEGTTYATEPGVKSYLLAHYSELSTLTSEALEPSQANRIAAFFAESGVKIPLLNPLAENVRSSFVARNLYEVSRDNISSAIGNEASLALDAIRTVNVTVYKYLIENLSAYLRAIHRFSPTVEAPEYFTQVISDILERSTDQIGEVIERSSAKCSVKDLSRIPVEAWPTLAKHERFPATFDNIRNYVERVGALDANVAKVLATRRSIANHNVVTEEAKSALARTILAARSTLPSPRIRSNLVASLELGNYLGIEDIQAETGELFAHLLKHKIIQDDADSYRHLVDTDWPTREAYIQESEAFQDYVTPDLVQSDLAMLLSSEKIDIAIKTLIVERAGEFAENAGSRALTQLAKFAFKHGHRLDEEIVLEMALCEVPTPCVVSLLEPHLASLGRDQLLTILQSLDGDYARLSIVGHDKPKIPNTAADRALLEQLKLHGIVASYDEYESPIKVNKRHK